MKEINVNFHEVEKAFTIPIEWFQTNKPDSYQVRVEVQPTVTDQQGNLDILFPAKKLGLPEKYHQPWGDNKMRILVYKTENEIIWGITAEIIFYLIHLLNKK